MRRLPVAPTRFPRPRGDGPGFRRLFRHCCQVPPPTRGWSRWTNCAAAGLSGSPAHAGMVPLVDGLAGIERRFPRPRGDGPAFAALAAGPISVPPPTRGWSRRHHSGNPEPCGSPAHAGMVPCADHRRGDPVRFPRPRGDGPDAFNSVGFKLAVPPPTRGWSFRKLMQLIN